MRIKQQRILSIFLSFFLLLFSFPAGDLSVKAEENDFQYTRIGISINSYAYKNRVPIEVKINGVEEEIQQNTKFRVTLLKGYEVIRQVTEGDENFKRVDETGDTYILAFLPYTESGKYSVKVEAKVNDEEYMELRRTEMELHQRKINISSKYISSHSMSFHVNISGIGGDIFKDVNTEDITIELCDKANEVVATSSSLLSEESIWLNKWKDNINHRFDEEGDIEVVNIGATLYRVDEMSEGKHRLIIRVEDKVVIDNELNVEVVDKPILEGISYENEEGYKIPVPGTRNFDVRAYFIGDIGKSDVSIILKDMDEDGSVVGRSISSEYNGFDELERDVNVLYHMEMVDGKVLQSGHKYSFQIESDKDIVINDDHMIMWPVEELKVVNFDDSKINNGILKVKLVNFEKDEEVEARLYNTKENYMNEESHISSVMAKVNDDGTVLFIFKDENGNRIELTEGYFGINLFRWDEEGEKYQFCGRGHGVEGYYNDSVKEIFSKDINVINPKTTNFNTNIQVKNVVPNKKNTTIKLVDEKGNEVGNMESRGMNIKYWGRNYNTDIYIISGNIKITDKLQNDKNYKYIIECDGEVLEENEFNNIEVTDAPKASSISLAQEYQDKKDEKLYLGTNVNIFDLYIKGDINAEDIDKFDIVLSDGKTNAAVLVKNTLIMKEAGQFSKNIIGQLKVVSDLHEGEYCLIVKYNGKELQRKLYNVTDSIMFEGYHFNRTISNHTKTLKINFWETVNVDPDKMNITIDDLKGNTSTCTVNKDSITKHGNYVWFDVKLPELHEGTYSVNIEQEGRSISEDIENPYWRNRLTITKNPIITEYIVKNINNQYIYYLCGETLNNNSEYKGFIFTDFDYGRTKYVKEIKIKLVEGNKLEILPESLEELPYGGYRIFIEMDGVLVGERYLNFRDHSSEGEYEDRNKEAYFEINNEAEYTNNKTVKLDIYSTGYSYMRISNNEQALKNEKYISYSDEMDWTLSGKDGPKNVYMQFKDDEGKESKVLRETIHLDTAVPEKPVVLQPTENDALKLNSHITIKAEAKENVKLYAEICKGNEVIKTLRLYNANESDNGYIFIRRVNLSNKFKDETSIRVYAVDFAGNKSEVAVQKLNVVENSELKGKLTKFGKICNGTMIILKKKIGDKYLECRWKTTDENGEFSFKDIAPGQYKIFTYEIAGFNEINEEVTVESGKTLVKDIAYTDKYEGNREDLKILVKDQENKPVENVDVSINNWNLGEYYSSTSDNNGEVTFEQLPVDNNYSLSISYKGFNKHEEFAIKKGTENIINLTIPRMEPISGIVVDENKKTLGNVEIEIKDNNGDYTWARTDSNGQYSVYVKTGEEYTISVQPFTRNLSLYVAKECENVQAGDKDINFTLYKGIKAYGKVVDNNGAPLNNVEVYINNRNNYFGKRAFTDENGNYDFGYSLELGEYDISSWMNGYNGDNTPINVINITTPTAITLDRDGNEKTTTDAAIELRDLVLDKWNMNDAFIGEYNGVKTDCTLTQRGKNVNVKVYYQNKSGRDLKKVTIKSESVNGITVVNGKLQKTVDSLKQNEKGELSFVIKVDNDFQGDNFVISASAEFDGEKASIGYASIDVVSATINGPKQDCDGSFKIYGEAAKDAEVIIMDKLSGKILAVTKTVGKWYSAQISNLSEGNYELVAKVEKGTNTAISEALNLEVKQDAVEVEEARFVSQSGQNIGINEETGIPAFSVWTDYKLNGKPITAYVELTSTLEEGYTGEFEFLGKTYEASLENDTWTANIKDWSGTGVQKVYFIIKDSNGVEKFRFTVAELTILIDPSGYVFDKGTGDRIEGATAICEFKDESGNWTKWDAEKYGQVNPQLTDAEGKYGWMVPAGTYRVRVHMDGYKDYVTTEDSSIEPIVIPLPRMDVNIGLERIAQNEEFNVEDIIVKEDGLTIKFNRSVNMNTINNSTIKICDEKGNDISGIFASDNESNTQISFISDEELKIGSYSIVLDDGVEDKDGNKLAVYADEFIIAAGAGTFEIKEVTVDKFELNSEGKVIISAENYTKAQKEVVLIVALYNAKTNKMIKYVCDNKVLESGENIELQGGFKMPETGDYKVKYFVWDNLEDMNSLLPSKVIK